MRKALLLIAACAAAALPGAAFIVSSAAAPRVERVSFSCDTDASCAALPPCAQKSGCDGSPYTAPFALVGYGCAGAKGPLYRDQEDEFPAPCAAIERLWER